MPQSGDSRLRTARRSDANPWLSVDVVEDAGDWSSFTAAEDDTAAAASALARHRRFAGRAAASACVALSDDACVRRLNAAYRDKDKATNVLSFPTPQDHSRRAGGEPLPLGDIVLAVETVVREAREQGLPARHHLQHLVVHGLLHLLGFDHETDAEAREMEALEIEILAGLGIANPYAEAEGDAPVHSGHGGTLTR